MTESLDALLAELSRTLLALDDEGDPDARRVLEARRDEIREVLRGVDMDELRPTAELLEEHKRLEARLVVARKERVKKAGTKYLGATQTVGGGVVPAEINRMIDAANRLDDLEARFEHLTAILESRGALGG